jgi:hypothetical protein
MITFHFFCSSSTSKRMNRLVPFLAVVVVCMLAFELFELTTRDTSIASVDVTDLHRAITELHAHLDAQQLHNKNNAQENESHQNQQQQQQKQQKPQIHQRFGRQAPASAQDLAPSGKRFHFIISSDCRYPPKNHWQSVVLLYSFFATQVHTSVFTEVLSCHSATWTPPWHEYFTPAEQARVRFHVAPAHNPHPVTGDEYAPYNKPNGLLHWVAQTGGPYEYDIVILTDWDNIMLRPFPPELLTEISDGHAQSALYGIGTSWATNAIAKSVCPDWCPKKSTADIDAVGGAGAPLAWSARDFRNLLPLWLNYTEVIRSSPPAREVAGWMAEMYGYCLGALKLGIRHQLHGHWMLSSSHPFEWNENLEPPVVLHYCQTYHIGEDWHFYKYDISAHDALSCDFPLLEEPPRDIGTGTAAQRVVGPDVWIANSLIMYINRAFMWYKERACKENWPGRYAPRWRPQPDNVGEMANAPGGTWMRRGP